MSLSSQTQNQKQRKKRKKISHRYLYNAGLYYLERFPASVAHFKSVMIRKIDRSFDDHPDQDRGQAMKWVDEVAKRFEELGYLNDRQYATGLIRSLRRKGLPSLKVIQKSREKGVERALATEVLQMIDEEYRLDISLDDERADLTSYDPDFEAALTYCRRKRMSALDYQQADLDQEEAYKLKNKYLGRLARQGFSFDVANRALENSSKD